MRNCLIGLVLSLLILLAGCTLWGEHKPRVWKDVTGGESLERVFWGQLKNKKWTELEPHMAANYVLGTPGGTLDHAAALEHWKQLDIQDYSLGEFNTQLSGDTYVVTYTALLHGKLAGQPLPETPMRVMGVWQHVARDWFAVAHSIAPASQVKETAP
jgi:hypothetical protein